MAFIDDAKDIAKKARDDTERLRLEALSQQCLNVKEKLKEDILRDTGGGASRFPNGMLIYPFTDRHGRSLLFAGFGNPPRDLQGVMEPEVYKALAAYCEELSVTLKVSTDEVSVEDDQPVPLYHGFLTVSGW